nr:MAG TPA: hypothetical protein [Microviridae sp.]
MAGALRSPLLFICLAAPYLQPFGLAVGARSRAPVAPSTALTPSPSSGAPRVPAPDGRAPPRWSGLRESGSRVALRVRYRSRSAPPPFSYPSFASLSRGFLGVSRLGVSKINGTGVTMP